MNDDILFYRKGSLHDFLEAKKLILRTEIESQDSDYLLNVSEEDFCQYLLKKYSIQPPELKEDETYIQDHGEARIDVSQDYRRGIFDRDRPFYIKGTQVTIAIPFKGDSGLFQYQPNLISSPPRGKILGQEVHLVYETVDHDSEKLKSRYNADIKRIKEWLRWVQNAVDNFNQSLEPLITQTVKKRKEKLLKDQGMVAKLGIPIKKSEDLPKTYSIPLEQKELKIAKPAATTEPFEPEPALDIEKYENVLETIQHMTFVMERNPKTFSNLKEEQIRDLFLLILNANYKGQATGETFRRLPCSFMSFLRISTASCPPVCPENFVLRKWISTRGSTISLISSLSIPLDSSITLNSWMLPNFESKQFRDFAIFLRWDLFIPSTASLSKLWISSAHSFSESVTG